MLAEIQFFNDGSANDGKIQLKMTNAPPTVGVTQYTVFWGVVGPLGTVRDINTDPGSVFAISGGTVTVYIDIPLDGDGNYLQGLYTFSYRIIDEDEFYEESTAAFEYIPHVTPGNPVSGEAVLTASFNCLNAKVTALDETPALDGYVNDSRLLSILPPQIAGQAAPVAVTTNAASLEAVFAWNYAPYQVGLTIVRTYSIMPDPAWDFSQVELLVANTTLNIVCNTDMCDAASCLETEYLALDVVACNLGGWEQLSQKQKANLEKAGYQTLIALAYRQCGNYNKAATYGALAADCNCGCVDTATTSSPEPYTAPVS